jgi:hypothetical protein
VDAVSASVDFKETGQLNPNVRTAIAYNADSMRIPPMRFNGILLAQVVPVGGLVSGTSSVMQLDAWNWDDALVKNDDGVHINWPSQSIKLIRHLQHENQKKIKNMLIKSHRLNVI